MPYYASEINAKKVISGLPESHKIKKEINTFHTLVNSQEHQKRK